MSEIIARNTWNRKHVSRGQQQPPFAFYMRLNQIPDEWHQIAVKFRHANGSVIATGREVIGECVEEIRVEVGRKMLREALVCLEVLQ